MAKKTALSKGKKQAAVKKAPVKKAASKKPAAKKPAAKKPAAKKTVSKKPAAKKTVKKPADTKSKKTAVKKPVAAAANKAKKAPPPPAKKPAKPAPQAKAKPVEKKVLAKSAVTDKSKLKKPDKVEVKSPINKKDESKKAPQKVVAKKEVEEKVIAPTKKGREAPVRSAATANPNPAKQVPPPIKVEPKIIETAQPEVMRERPDGDLFSRDELNTFRDLLQQERGKLLTKARKTMEEGNIAIDKNEMMDEVDQASAMVEQNLMFRLLDRDRKLLSEIDHALIKIETGEYGYCEGTGEPIPKRRLELRPWCRHSVKYKEKLERMKKSGRGVVDEDEL